MKALIVGSGTICNHQLLKDRYEWADLVIAADGGAAHLSDLDLMPHVLLGDFDSISDAILRKVQEQKQIEVLSFPVNKDSTDMELAMNLAIDRGAGEIVILGACGSRLDHTTTNIFLLYNLLEREIKGCIEDDNNQIYLINNTLTITKQDNHKVSLLAVTPIVEGLTTRGLSYPLKDATLKFGSSWGISNEFNEDQASVSINKGLLLVFISKD